MSKVLIATLGLSPGVVTGAYFALQRDGHEINRVITLTTQHAASDLCAGMIAETLQTADPPPDYEPLKPVRGQDLRYPQATDQFRDALLAQLRCYGDAHELFVVLTGGRTSMAAAAMLAVQRYMLEKPEAADRLSLYHLEVTDEQLEELGTIRSVAGMTNEQERRYYLNPPGTAIQLVQLPALTLEREPKHVWARLFEYATGAYLLNNPAYEKMRYYFNPTYLAQAGLGEVHVYAEKFIEGAITEIEKVDYPQLRGLIAQAFSLPELTTLCYDLHVDEDEFRPTKTLFITDLIGYMERYGRLPELITLCEQERPKYNWRAAIQLREVLLCECELSQEPIGTAVIESLARKMEVVMAETKRPAQGWVVSSTPYAQSEALARAQEAGIALYHARLPENWNERHIWQIKGDLQWMVAAPENAGA